MHLEHKPGDTMQVDWAGQTAGIVDTDTGELIPAYLFVSVLPYSRYAYVEAFLDEKQEAWITARIHAYQFYGGVTRILTPDNLNTGFIRNTKDETIINKTYQEMAEHYGTAKAKASNVTEALGDAKKKKIFYKYMSEVPMAGFLNSDGTYTKGIEDFLLENGQYRTDEYQKMVVEDILENWEVISHGRKFHGIFATSSIPEAVEYYGRFKSQAPELKVTALFDPSIDNNGTGIAKEEALAEILQITTRGSTRPLQSPPTAK